MFSRSRAGAAATLRPRPFFGAAVAAAIAGEGGGGGGGRGTSTGDGNAADGVAAAAAAVLSYMAKSATAGVDASDDGDDDEAFPRGATLGAVSEAAVRPSSLRAPTGQGLERRRGGEGARDDEESLEWMARHTVDFLDAAALLQAALSQQYCTPESCPAMRAGPRHEYLWAEPSVPGRVGGTTEGEASCVGARPASSSTKRNKKPSRLPAPLYASALFSWADALLASPLAFPQSRGEPFPPGFKLEVLQPLYRRLARVFAHLYHAHWWQVSDADASFLGIDLSPHLNTVFKHYVAFGREHGLLPEQELDPVRPLVVALLPKATSEASAEEAEAEEDGKAGGGRGEEEASPASKAGGKGAVEVSAVVA